MSVRFEDIKVGDKVKVRYDGMVTEDWMTVEKVGKNGPTLYARIDHWTFYSDNSEIIAHQPAPHKVEVTLGKPLSVSDGGFHIYRDTAGQEALHAWKNGAGIRLSEVRQSALPARAARRLALDILATVGIDDE